ncbi:MAG: UDP-N-acetylmuramate--L-alanine ligase, partial [Thermoplasmata archaeon]
MTVKFGKTKQIHFIGIGGIGMSGIAELLLNLGYRVSGSDLKTTAVTKNLAGLGGEIFQGHREEHVEKADVVVYSSAVGEDNPEIVAAKKRFVPVIPRAEMLAELMRLKYGIAIAGAHGKTTTTSMVASILTKGGLDPTAVIGGRLDTWGGSNARLGEGDILVAEADESDGSFLALSPIIAVVTNIDQEHLDHYGNMEAIRKTFVDFINKVPFYGTSVLCLDNEEIQYIIPQLKKRYITYGLTSQADLQGREIRREAAGMRYEVFYQGKPMGEVLVGIPGEHNVLNSLAALGVGLELGLSMDAVRQGLKDLGGLARRFQVKGEKKDILVLDDYGHHPSEIVATLKTAREWWPDRRMVVVFQPHRYTRTQALFDRFVTSFNEADVLLVTAIYPASEQPIAGVTGETLSEGIREHGHKDVSFCGGSEETLQTLLSIVREGDLV